jgi:hypothetical protein
VALALGNVLLKEAQRLNDVKMRCFARDLIASVYTEIGSPAKVHEAVAMFEEIRAISAEYYSPNFYEKAKKLLNRP